MSLEVQFLTVMLMAACGSILGAVFDTYRVVAGQVRLHRRLVPLIDLLYWIAATVLVFRVLYYSNYGDVRFYVFFGILFGISLYYALISPWLIRLVKLVLRGLSALARFGVRLFRLLVVRPLLFLYRVLVMVWGFLAALSVFMYKIMVQLGYPAWKLLKRLSGTAALRKPAARMRHWLASSARRIKGIFRRNR